jgi:Ribose/xylose/arabinose/galactoside ABC-type transport systems, permease components
MNVSQTTSTPADEAEPQLETRPRRLAAAAGHVLSVLERYGLVVLFLLMFLVFSTMWNRPDIFHSMPNIRTVLGTYSVPAILALASIIPLVCGQFDLTVGSIASLTAIFTAAGVMTHHASPAVAMIIAVAIGTAFGAINGFLVAYVRVNALITTLGMASVIAGILEWYTNGNTILLGVGTLTNLGSLNWLGIPRLVFFVVAIALLIYYLLQHTPFGRYLHSVGSNATAARLVGLKVERLIFFSFVLSGTVAGIAGVLLLARNGSANQQLGGPSLTLSALAAAFLGATTIRPGRFNVLGTLVAVFFVGFSLSGLNLNNVANWVSDFFVGSALVLAVAISTVVGRRRAAGG